MDRPTVRCRESHGAHMTVFVQALQNNPELAIFLTLAVGLLIGRLKFGSVQSRHCRGNALRRGLDRTARHQSPANREGHILRSLPLHYRLQGRATVLSRTEKGRDSAGVAHRGPLSCMSLHSIRFREAAGLRHRYGSRAPRWRVFRVDSDRHRGRGDSAPPAVRCGEKRPAK